jgi:hypothetical protein
MTHRHRPPKPHFNFLTLNNIILVYFVICDLNNVNLEKEELKNQSEFCKLDIGPHTTMKASTKGAFLSGLVYPGTGQMFFGRIFSGLACISLVTIGLGVLIYRFAKRIYLAIDPAIPMWDNNTLSFQKFITLMNQTEYAGWNVELFSLAVVVFCWITSFVHAYFVGKRLDRS